MRTATDEFMLGVVTERALGLRRGDVHVVCGSVGEPRSLATLDEAERARARSFVRPEDGARFARARALLRRVLGRCLGRPAGALRFAYGPFGKPALEGAPDLYFNLAHSGDRVVIALAVDREVGVDLEVRSTVRPSTERMLFTPWERRRLARLGTAERARAARLLAVTKEAVVKAEGSSVFRACDLEIAFDERGPRVIGDAGMNVAVLGDDAEASLVLAARGAALTSVVVDEASFG